MKLSEAQILQQLRQLEASQFERFLAAIWDRRGWETDVTTESRDRGVDVVVTRNNPYQEKKLIQAKRYRAGNRVGSPEIREYNSLKDQEENVDQVLIVTTSDFTEDARSIANKLNVKCIDGPTLVQIVRSADAGDLVERYVQGYRHSDLTEIDDDSRPDCEKDAPLRCVGTDIVAELIGMEPIEFSKSSSLSLGEDFEGIVIAMNISTHGLADDRWLPIKDREQVVITDRYTYEYSPIEMSEKPLATGWQTHDPTVRNREGSRNVSVDVRIENDTKYLAAVELPKFSDVKKSKRVDKVKRIEIPSYDINFELDETDSNVSSLPRDIRASIVSAHGVDVASDSA